MSIQVITAPVVNVRITSNLSSFQAEKRFDRGITVAELKGRLELVTGASLHSMAIDVYDEKDKHICTINNNDALFGSFPVEENYRLHVTDPSHRPGEFEDTSGVERYKLSDEEYAKKSDSVRSFLMHNKLGKYNEQERERIEAGKQREREEEEVKAKSLSVGQRCEVRSPGDPVRRGEVMFVGKTQFKDGMWVGVKFDEPLGKNDGSVAGIRYFETPVKYGGFVRPAYVEVGDFPEIEYDTDEM